MLRLSPAARISPLADIEESVRGTVIEVGPDTVVDAFVKIKPAGGTGDVIIGSATYINSGCVLYSGNGLRIGNGVLIAANCTFAPVNHEFRSKYRSIIEQRFQPSRGGIIVEDDVWIGANCVLLDGAVLRRGCVIGAGSIVAGAVDAYTINVGNPLTTIGSRT